MWNEKVFCLKRVSVDYLLKDGTIIYYTSFSTFTFEMTSLDTQTKKLHATEGLISYHKSQ